MSTVNETAETTFNVLDKYAEELQPEGRWRWQCVVRNGVRLPISASLEEGFLRLACRPKTIHRTACTLERAMLGNRTLAGGVKLALSSAGHGLFMTTDIAVLEQKQLHDRFRRALDGFHDGYRLLRSSSTQSVRPAAEIDTVDSSLADLLRQVSWATTEHSPGSFSAALDASSAPPARITMSGSGVVLGVELVRANMAEESTRQALAVFLLTASGLLRLARAFAEEENAQTSYGFQVCLTATPALEEIDHGLAALSIAYRTCAREANALLSDAVARCYMATRGVSTTNDHQPEEEN